MDGTEVESGEETFGKLVFGGKLAGGREETCDSLNRDRNVSIYIRNVNLWKKVTKSKLSIDSNRIERITEFAIEDERNWTRSRIEHLSLHERERERDEKLRVKFKNDRWKKDARKST